MTDKSIPVVFLAVSWEGSRVPPREGPERARLSDGRCWSAMKKVAGGGSKDQRGLARFAHDGAYLKAETYACESAAFGVMSTLACLDLSPACGRVSWSGRLPEQLAEKR